MAGGFEVEFLEYNTCGADIRTLRFTRPAGYIFKPGQWFTLTLNTSQGLHTETFSHCSAPGDSYLDLTTRISGSPFKQALASLEPGARVPLRGPGGRLSIAEQVRRVVFLAGGVGITPIRSILRDAGQRGRTFDDALLLYGNRDESCAPFLGEFEALGGIGLRVVVCYERPPVGWLGESGFITAETGPPAMVDAMGRVLDDLAVTEERRLIERFTTGK